MTACCRTLVMGLFFQTSCCCSYNNLSLHATIICILYHTLPYATKLQYSTVLNHTLQYSVYHILTWLYHTSTILYHTLLYTCLAKNHSIHTFLYLAKLLQFLFQSTIFSCLKCKIHQLTWKLETTKSLHLHIFCPFAGFWCTENSCVWSIKVTLSLCNCQVTWQSHDQNQQSYGFSCDETVSPVNTVLTAHTARWVTKAFSTTCAFIVQWPEHWELDPGFPVTLDFHYL